MHAHLPCKGLIESTFNSIQTLKQTHISRYISTLSIPALPREGMRYLALLQKWLLKKIRNAFLSNTFAPKILEVVSDFKLIFL